MNSIGLVVMAVIYLELEPVYMCTNASGTSICTAKEMCANNDFTSYAIDYSSPFTLKNWV